MSEKGIIRCLLCTVLLLWGHSWAQPFPERVANNYSGIYKRILNDEEFQLQFKDSLNGSLAEAVAPGVEFVLDETYTHLSAPESDYGFTASIGAVVGSWLGVGGNILFRMAGRGTSFGRALFSGASVGAVGGAAATYWAGWDCPESADSFDVDSCSPIRVPVARTELQYSGRAGGMQTVFGNCRLYFAFPEIRELSNGFHEYLMLYEIDECSHGPRFLRDGTIFTQERRGYNDVRLGGDVDLGDILMMQEFVVAKDLVEGVVAPVE